MPLRQLAPRPSPKPRNSHPSRVIHGAYPWGWADQVACRGRRWHRGSHRGSNGCSGAVDAVRELALPPSLRVPLRNRHPLGPLVALRRGCRRLGLRGRIAVVSTRFCVDCFCQAAASVTAGSQRLPNSLCALGHRQPACHTGECRCPRGAVGPGFRQDDKAWSDATPRAAAKNQTNPSFFEEKFFRFGSTPSNCVSLTPNQLSSVAAY